ncbi:MAG: glycoside hydrolase family 127 protein [candidate division KSB1 bacterium]|nr:glycoside hydrolase family 127 protein [candidate division KSB1 bacterium]MDZ7302379.1 glycoside hydrolase family 127 protein [candidate division KSB1 bacterium]
MITFTKSRNVLVLGFSLFMLSCGVPQISDYPIQSVPLKQVKLHDSFWAPRIETNRTVTIPAVFQKCEETGRVDNLAIAAGLKKGEQQGSYPFDDSDVYKTIEAASYALMLQPDPKLEAYLDSLIQIISGAQEDDGYLYTARTNQCERLKNWFGDQRWIKEQGSHELYNIGHLYEAAAAHYQATGKRSLLDVALKSANLVDQSFGPDKLKIPPGHQVIEMGLAKLYRITQDKRYLDLAKFFLEVRGKSLDGRQLWGEYSQDHKPVLEQDEAVGHAVRAAYLYSGMADVAALTQDHAYLRAIDRLWQNVVQHKLYITGGIGAKGAGEAFGANDDLPNMSAYNETCASIANIFWNQRLFLSHGEAQYIDVLERTLYNAMLSGYSLDGKTFFYPNPLASMGQHARTPWFTCACCPPNVARLMASLPSYFYAQKDNEIFVNLFASSTAEIALRDQTVRLTQETRYPWDGRIKITLTPQRAKSAFTVNLRIPGWATNRPVPSDLYRYLDPTAEPIVLTMNGEKISYKTNKGYARLKRAWSSGDVIELTLPMPIHRVVAHDSVRADRGRVALQRGPMVFCAEWPDQPDGHVRHLLVPDEAVLQTEFVPDLLNGVQIIRGKTWAYRLAADGQTLEKAQQDFQAIPYYAWAHRGSGEMAVWLAREESAVQPLGQPTLASTSRVSASFGKNPQAVNDQLLPQSSSDHEVPYYHCWPHKDTTEWIQYDFPQEAEVSMVEVYWFDDTGIGECRPPRSWRLLYKENNEWLPVYTTGTYGVQKDAFNKVTFETVRTRALRLEFQLQEQFAAGIHEWRVQ